MKILVYSKILKDDDIPYVKVLFDELRKNDCKIYVFEPYLEMMKAKISSYTKNIIPFSGYHDFENKDLDYVISMGGDGTMLGAITVVRDKCIPILGINLGRLGFLASIEKSKIKDAVDCLVQKTYSIDKRNLLALDSDLPLFGETKFALNDFTLLKRDTSGVIQIKAYINGELLNNYWADGLIVSTPTGSTGYSLSCGGPVIFPNASNFIVTPVAPHNINVRPIVIPDNVILSFEVDGRGEQYLCTLDSRFERITKRHRIAVKKADFQIHLIQMPKQSFIRTIQEKLIWGSDVRG